MLKRVVLAIAAGLVAAAAGCGQDTVSTSDNVVSLVSLALLVVAPLYLLWLTRPHTASRRRSRPAIAARGGGA